jgi:hypothetical protein
VSRIDGLRADLVNQTSPSHAKIALFRSLLRGREDVYRRRFESRKTGKAGYADLNAPMLARMFDRRCCGYEAVCYTILLPASAIPGWPVDVVFPSSAFEPRRPSHLL